jgi:hypothetical protein
MTRTGVVVSRRRRIRTTLLELVARIGATTSDDAQVVRATLRALRAGRARPEAAPRGRR